MFDLPAIGGAHYLAQCLVALLATHLVFLLVRWLWGWRREGGGSGLSLHYRADSRLCAALVGRCSTLRESYTPPLLWGRSGHVQTLLFGLVGRFRAPEVEGHRHSLLTPDGSTVTYDVFEPEGSKPSHTVIVCPGIGNSSESDYIRTFSHYATSHGGYRVAVLNHVGVSKSEPITGNRIFSYGGTGDMAAVFDDLCQHYPDTWFIGVGFSLGACILVRFLGENPSRQEKFVCAASLCQGYDPWQIAPHYNEWSQFRFLYNMCITRKHLRTIRRHRHSLLPPATPPDPSATPRMTTPPHEGSHNHQKPTRSGSQDSSIPYSHTTRPPAIEAASSPAPSAQMPPGHAPQTHRHQHSSATCTCKEASHVARDCNGFALGPAPWEAPDEARLWGVGCILELDELYTRRVMGFSSVEELYRWASCVESLWRVADLPLLLLNSRDDPLIPEVMHAIPRDYTEHNANALFVVTDHGGHLGFFEGGVLQPRSVGWLDRLILEFSAACIQLRDETAPDRGGVATERGGVAPERGGRVS